MKLELFDRYRDLVDDWQGFAESLGRPLPTCLWANPLSPVADRLAERLEREGLAAEPLGWYPGGFKLAADAKPGRTLSYLAGLFHAQEEVSLLPAVLLDPQPGERVLDLCAAPGGKACQMAVRMGDLGTVIANDRDKFRLGILVRHLERLGITSCVALCSDGTNFSRRRIGLFDRVLADVPCSCEGTVRKNPEFWEHYDPARADRLLGSQRALLRKAFQLCKPGGRIAYATCTFNPDENEAIVNGLLAEVGPGAVRLLPAKVAGLRTVPGLTAWGGERFSDKLELALRVYPHHNDTGGFFVALLEKLP